MVSLMAIPNFKGTKNQKVIMSITAILLDSLYIIPMINHIIK